jgi:hypothetical protein
MFLTHPKPRTKEEAEVFKALANKTLSSHDTWEVGLSTGGNKFEVFTRLLKENKLGALALLRNLRNMLSVGVDEELIKDALDSVNVSKVFPFRFIAAAKYASPSLEPAIESAMFKTLVDTPTLLGHTAVLIDVSGSMSYPLSDNSSMTRIDAATGLAMCLREICESCSVWTFSNAAKEYPARRGFALRDLIMQNFGGATYLGKAVKTVNAKDYDRLVVVTDEQSQDNVGGPNGLGYMINVSPYARSVGYGPWIRINGWSDAVLQYMVELESLDLYQ